MPRNMTLKREAPAEPAEEPPGRPRDEEDDPPDGSLANRRRLFPDAPDQVWNDWKWQFRNRITTVDRLAELLPLTPKQQTQFKLVTTRFPLSITPHYLCRADLTDPCDPVLRQCIPSVQEMTMSDMGFADPLAEHEHSVVPGLVHRYPDRVLMVTTDLCAMLCRHCTRKREWHNGGWVRPWDEIEAMLRYISEHREVRDVVVSGGDPLVMATDRLERIIAGIRRIKHVEIIRIGTRFPVVLPQRIDDELCNMLSKYGPIWLNTHFNHAREISPESMAACDRLLRAGVPVNNQTVLLRGVNDTVKAQLALSHGLLKAKVRPYYLFQCDEVQGTEHLRTSIETGLKIIEGMRGHTSGLAVPTYVVDLTRGGGKVPLQPEYILSRNKDHLILRNYEGKLFKYANPGARDCAEKVEYRQEQAGERSEVPELLGA